MRKTSFFIWAKDETSTSSSGLPVNNKHKLSVFPAASSCLSSFGLPPPNRGYLSCGHSVMVYRSSAALISIDMVYSIFDNLSKVILFFHQTAGLCLVCSLVLTCALVSICCVSLCTENDVMVYLWVELIPTLKAHFEDSRCRRKDWDPTKEDLSALNICFCCCNQSEYTKWEQPWWLQIIETVTKYVQSLDKYAIAQLTTPVMWKINRYWLVDVTDHFCSNDLFNGPKKWDENVLKFSLRQEQTAKKRTLIVCAIYSDHLSSRSYVQLWLPACHSHKRTASCAECWEYIYRISHSIDFFVFCTNKQWVCCSLTYFQIKFLAFKQKT
jgi:hypothetical protein